jgi:hypothetical protein
MIAPYFNEPGYEQGTNKASDTSFHNNVKIIIKCVEWAMIDQLKNHNIINNII